jgi:hypothetical protein
MNDDETDCYTDLSHDEELNENLIEWGIWKFIQKLEE